MAEDKAPGIAAPSRSARVRWIKLVAFVVLIAAIAIVSRRYNLKELLTFDNIYAQIDLLREWAHRPYGPIVFIVIGIAVLLLHLPEIVVIVAGGLLYELWEAFLYCWIGCSGGIIGAFLISRFFLRDYFRPILEKTFLVRFERRLEKDGFMIMLMLRLIFFLTPTLTWPFAATAIKTKDFIIGSCVGLAPPLFGVLLTISKLREVNQWTDLLSLQTFAVIAAFVVAVLVIFGIRRKYFPEQ